MAEDVLQQKYDTVIIGGGPAGLSAAVYTAREGMKTLVLDKTAFGGMAAITETIDNYPGFSKGVGGLALTDEMTAQAERFGAALAPFHEVTGISTKDKAVSIEVGDTVIQARAALITTGSTYRRLGVPGEAELIGRGVHYCATCDGPLYRNKRLAVIGGGNSALQESLFLAHFASSVDILVRGEAFNGSDILERAVAAEKHIRVHYNTKVNRLARTSPASPILIEQQTGDTTNRLETDGVFVFIGLLPNTHGLNGVAADDRGFVLSDNSFQTNLPGVFVAGDVRSGSTWQIGSAVGEGVSAALIMRHYLDEHFPGWHKKTGPPPTSGAPV